MHRAVLITLLAVPLLVIMHIALFWQPISWSGETVWASSRNGEQLKGYWQPSEQTVPSRFAINHTTEQGS